MTLYWDLVLALVLIVLLVVAAPVSYRLVAVRRSAIPTVVRHRGRADWRYGALHYTRDEARFFRLFSLRFGPDLRIVRASIDLGGRRDPTGPELEFAEDGEKIVELTGHRYDGRPVELEVCLDPRSITALLSWVEACSTEAVRSVPPRGRGERGRR